MEAKTSLVSYLEPLCCVSTYLLVVLVSHDHFIIFTKEVFYWAHVFISAIATLCTGHGQYCMPKEGSSVVSLHDTFILFTGFVNI